MLLRFDGIHGTIHIFILKTKSRIEKVLVPKTDYDALKDEDQLFRQQIENLHPHEEDAIIIGFDNSSKKRAEFAAENAALKTIMSHEIHRVFIRKI